ncbi:hypothetical protein H4R34_002046 [Dimargaris verticillata]|uniref:Wbp11/ELF5/Saf1 N-terminal domain-containing protein n=1 Tax=Dimargaris verticillata TaxID=2761393 RepID=A0A9W8B9J4_9FUNG|nr:hypothetical protein H4R34_002046 [Dimargaris verticillata]
MGRNTKSGRTLNPMDALRRQQRKRELKKNKDTRKKVREFGLLAKDTEKIEAEIERYQELKTQRRLDKQGAEKLQRLSDQLAKIHEVRKVHGLPEHGAADIGQPSTGHGNAPAVHGLSFILGESAVADSDSSAASSESGMSDTDGSGPESENDEQPPEPVSLEVLGIEIEGVSTSDEELPPLPPGSPPPLPPLVSEPNQDSVLPEETPIDDLPPLPPGPPPPLPPTNSRPPTLPAPLPPHPCPVQHQPLPPPGFGPRPMWRPMHPPSGRPPMRPMVYPSTQAFPANARPIRPYQRPRPPHEPGRVTGGSGRPNRPPPSRLVRSSVSAANPTVLSAAPQVRDLQKELTSLVPNALLRKQRAQRKQQGSIINSTPYLPRATPTGSEAAPTTNTEFAIQTDPTLIPNTEVFALPNDASSHFLSNGAPSAAPVVTLAETVPANTTASISVLTVPNGDSSLVADSAAPSLFNPFGRPSTGIALPSAFGAPALSQPSWLTQLTQGRSPLPGAVSLAKPATVSAPTAPPSTKAPAMDQKYEAFMKDVGDLL